MYDRATTIRIDSAERSRKTIDHFVNIYYLNGPDAAMNNPQAFRQALYKLYQTLFNQTLLQKHQHVCIHLAEFMVCITSFNVILRSF